MLRKQPEVLEIFSSNFETFNFLWKLIFFFGTQFYFVLIIFWAAQFDCGSISFEDEDAKFVRTSFLVQIIVSGLFVWTRVCLGDIERELPFVVSFYYFNGAWLQDT